MAGYDGRGARFNIVAVEGNDLSFTVTAVDDADAAIDLSAATITASIYNGAGTVIDTLTDAVSGAGSNIITLSLTDAEVDALTEPKSWALVVERGGDARTWLAGSFTVSDASRARGGTSGTAITATVDTNVTVTVNTVATVNDAHITDTVDAHDASAISILDTAGNYTATTVEGALAELPGQYAPGAYRQIRLSLGATATEWQAALDTVEDGLGPIKVSAEPGTYTVRNLEIHGDTWLDLYGVTLQHGGSFGTVAPLEGVPSTLYAEGGSGTELTGVRITGGKIIGLRTGSNYVDRTTDGQDALQLNYCNNAIVDGVTFEDHNQDAVTLANSSGTVVSNCRMTRCNDGGVELRSGSGYRCINNVMRLIGDGFPAKPDVTNVIIHGNDVEYFRDGAINYPARSWQITNNRFAAVTAPDGTSGISKPAILIIKHPTLTPSTNTHSDILIRGNVIQDISTGIGIKLDATSTTISRVTIDGNTFTNCHNAILTGAASAVVISANVIRTAAPAIEAVTISVGGASCSVSGNSLAQNSAYSVGISLLSTATDCVVRGNTIVEELTSPLQIIRVYGARCSVVGNTLKAAASSNGQCIEVTGDENVIANNTVSGHNHGIRLTSTAENNVVSGNMVRGGVFTGVQVQSGATKTLVVGNMLLNNPTPLSDSGTGTTSASNVVA